MEDAQDPADPALALVVRAPAAGLVGHAPPRVPPHLNPARIYVASLAIGNSQRTIASALQSAVNVFQPDGACAWDAFPWWWLRRGHTQALRARLAERYAVATANKILTAVRQVLLECRRSELGLMSADDCAAACDFKPVRGSRLQAGRALTTDELASLLASLGDRPIDLRDRCLLALLSTTGLRREEAATLRLEDYDAARSSLRVIGKGNKQREVPVSAGLATSIRAWLAVRGPAPGPLLSPVGKAGRVRAGDGISGVAVREIVSKLAERASVVGIRPHDFRRTFVSILLEDKRDVATVAKLVGHASILTTAKYDRRGDKAARQAIDRIDDLLAGKTPAGEK